MVIALLWPGRYPDSRTPNGSCESAVTSTYVTENEYDGREVYEDIYCARGEMEIRIKEQQLDLLADRTSTSKM